MKKNKKILFFLSSLLLITMYGHSKSFDFKKDFGAKGDGVTDDSKAWSEAIKTLSGKKGLILYIPKGLYRIGKQDVNISGRSFYTRYTQRLTNAENIKIIGETDSKGNNISVFKYMDNQNFGYFNSSNRPVNSDARTNRAEFDPFIRIENSCKNITISNLDIDGNLLTLNTGLNKKHNLQHIGIYINVVSEVFLKNLHIHHFGLDGIYVKTPYNGKKDNVVIDNVVSEYNGRQGLSFTSGQGLIVKNSTFRYTGKGGLLLSPGANVDIENHAPKGRFLEDILFENCILEDNAGGSGSLNLAGDIRRFRMKNSKIITSNWLAIQSNFSSSRDFIFENCFISGLIDFEYGGRVKKGNEITRFINCTIQDNKNNRTVGLRRALISVTDKVEFENCVFYKWDKRKLILSFGNGKDDKKSNTVVIREGQFFDVDSRKKINIKNNELSNRIQIIR